MSVIEFRLSDKDRERLGGDEWLPLDLSRLYDEPAHRLERWEAECGYAIDRACAELVRGRPPAKAVRVLVWIARKQTGDGSDPDSGQPEAFAKLQDLRTLPVQFRDRVEPEAADAVPPAESEPEPPAP